MKDSTTCHKMARIGLVALFWIAVWWGIALWLRSTTALPHNLLASPWETLQSLFDLLIHADFWSIITHSVGKIMCGFLLAFVSGNLLAVVCNRVRWMQTLLTPLVQLMKTAPVASVIAVVLIWISSSQLSTLIAFFVAFPITYLHMLQALSACDKQLTEMATVMRVSFWKQVRMLWLPQVLPFVVAGCRLSMGTAWKAGVAGEIIGVPDLSIGEQLYLSKLYLNTADLFAWTAVIILISILFEKIAIYGLSFVERRLRCATTHTN